MTDAGTIGAIALDWHFLASVASIVLIDLILAGDNAVVIAMAVRTLPREQRRKGILLGAGAAVLLRVVATFFVAKLLQMPYVKLAGGLAIGWIAVTLFMEGAPADALERKATSLWHAVRIVVIADITMSLDNMLAVGGASHGSFALLIFGLALSIPFVVLTSNLLAELMDRFPIIVYAGAAVLGKVAAEMSLTDPFTVGLLHPSRAAVLAAEALTAGAVIVAGRMLLASEAGRAVPAVTAEPGPPDSSAPGA